MRVLVAALLGLALVACGSGEYADKWGMQLATIELQKKVGYSHEVSVQYSQLLDVSEEFTTTERGRIADIVVYGVEKMGEDGITINGRELMVDIARTMQKVDARVEYSQLYVLYHQLRKEGMGRDEAVTSFAAVLNGLAGQ